jgi:LPPG:FO 2-phospho-L-lactate transferase
MLTELGHEASALGVARLYADVVSTFVIDTADAGLAAAIEAIGMRCIVTQTVMHGRSEAAALAEVTLR